MNNTSSFPWVGIPEEKFKEEFEFTPVNLLGSFDRDRYIFIQKTKDNEPGYQLVAPYVLNSGIKVIVDRGWVPLNWNDVKKDIDDELDKNISITGILYKGDKMNDYTLVSQGDILVNMNTDQLAKRFDIDADYIVKEINFGKEIKPYPQKLRPNDLMTWTIMPDKHQSYANFWLFVTTINIISNIYIWTI